MKFRHKRPFKMFSDQVWVTDSEFDHFRLSAFIPISEISKFFIGKFLEKTIRVSFWQMLCITFIFCNLVLAISIGRETHELINPAIIAPKNDNRYPSFKRVLFAISSFACVWQHSWHTFTTIARPMVGPQPVQSAMIPSSETIRRHASKTLFGALIFMVTVMLMTFFGFLCPNLM